MSDFKPPVETPAVQCAPPSPSQFDLLMKDYGVVLKTEQQQKSAAFEAEVIKTNTASQVVCVERKVNEKYARAVKEYNFLSNCVTVYTGQDLEGLTATVLLAQAKYTGIKTSFDAAVTAIKTAKQKAGLVNTLAGKLKDAVADSCNSEELKLIRENLSKGGPGKKNIEDSVQEFVAYAEKINNQADDVVQAAVKVAGINAFVNVDNLSVLIATAKTDGTGLITDVENNVKGSQKKYDDSRKPLGDALKDLSKASTLKNVAWVVKDAVADAAKFVEDKNCNGGGCKKLDDISEQAEHAFDCNNCDEPAEQQNES
ncbi:hypothetical protein [Chitinophaga pinensis]|uniref:Uncharacterized protein n=1 Tax=Chitinophaga pinensis (strain ATCC 43595 / DSM 2588 / LMG 13176 / NBRC 15968 / NCIMB 11800 / UQM 2034) TaxID=485918 RepID=A0A979G8M3_CHIPD|nr:hypothetical protein [Chitinophaga pinensis]ACU62687.1 hypothetical protein Cpin_5256 [Chitinophaga pinensis DSM 2588]